MSNDATEQHSPGAADQSASFFARVEAGWYCIPGCGLRCMETGTDADSHAHAARLDAHIDRYVDRYIDRFCHTVLHFADQHSHFDSDA